MKFLLLSFLLLTTRAISQQQPPTQWELEKMAVCGGEEEIMKIRGSWKKNSDAIIFPDNTFPRNQFAQVNIRIDNILPLMKESAPDLSGIEPRWYRVINGASYIPNGPLPYDFSSLYFSYYCNTNLKKILLGGETGTWVYVFVNHWSWLCDKVDDWDINNDGKKIGIFHLAPKAGKWKGLTLYAPRSHRNSSFAVVIGHDGKMPWHTLTRMQYLTGLKKMWEEKKKGALAHFDTYEAKARASMEASIKKMAPEIAEKVRQQTEENLKKFAADKEKNITGTSKFYDEKLNPILNYLAHASEEDLKEPAIMDPAAGPQSFKGKFGEEEKGGTRLVVITQKYFKPGLPRYVPQFMILYWRWSNNIPAYHFKKQFEENFPLEKLKAMIDK